ncbi:PD-(D/E)XK nuclease domain-containing protein [Marinitoga sp. 1154]|uniref:PD-(D/E)XK nuclease domain-containing protein n=1 Tax=Marinitoga sp. 1154 TaxID=1643335 RepID=UPI0015869060|nr:PD-(D/E)XK nuclease domain-containing protein [Marinitoga sp. 1154]
MLFFQAIFEFSLTLLIGHHIFEIKVDKSAIDAINQIKEKKYYEKYRGKEIYIIGININSEKRNIENYIIEKI